MTNLLDIITPTNLQSEREKFFQSNSYHPIFHYIWQDQILEPSFSIKLKYPLWEAIHAQDHSAIVHAAENLFEVKLTPTRLTDAKKFASVKGERSTGTADEYVRLLRAGLDDFGLTDIQVVLTDEAGFNARPQHAKKQILVSNHIHFGYFSMQGDARHELVHTLRYRNGKYNQVKRSQRFLPTEEGLASWCQDHTNSDNGLAQHAMEYVATDVGLRGSLRDIYNTMRDYGMEPELAWKRASRHKFGFVDTSQPGDILKPAMYFDNEMKVDKLTKDEKLRLFVGKIHQDELPNYPEYYGLWSPEQIMEYFHLQGETL